MNTIDAPIITTCTARIWSASGLRLADRAEQHPEVLVGADPDRVAGELAAPRVGGDRVAGVQRGVGLVGAHLVAMVGEVGPPVGQHRLVRRVAEQKRPTRSLARRFENSNRCAASWARMFRHTWPRVISTNASRYDHHVLITAAAITTPNDCSSVDDDGDDVAPVRDPAQLVAQLAGRLGALVEPLGRQHVGKRLGRWNKIGGWRHRDGHSLMLHCVIAVSNSSNTHHRNTKRSNCDRSTPAHWPCRRCSARTLPVYRRTPSSPSPSCSTSPAARCGPRCRGWSPTARSLGSTRGTN